MLKVLSRFLTGENSLSGQWNTPVKMKDTQLHIVDDQRIDTCTGKFTMSLEHQSPALSNSGKLGNFNLEHKPMILWSVHICT